MIYLLFSLPGRCLGCLKRGRHNFLDTVRLLDAAVFSWMLIFIALDTAWAFTHSLLEILRTKRHTVEPAPAPDQKRLWILAVDAPGNIWWLMVIVIKWL